MFFPTREEVANVKAEYPAGTRIRLLKIPTREEVANVKAKYPVGTRIRLLSMQSVFQSFAGDKILPGAKGTVTCVDDIGTIHVKWDNGSTLGIAYGEDSCEKEEEHDER